MEPMEFEKPESRRFPSRAQFARQMDDLRQDVLRMGGVVEQMLRKSTDAYFRTDAAAVRHVESLDDIVDQYNRDIEAAALHLLALQNPMARDLRTIAATMKIITDVERMGDYCIDIARLADLADVPPRESPLAHAPELAEMTSLAATMLRETLQAFVTRDIALVHQMIDHDDEVDHLNNVVHTRMVETARNNPDVAEQAIADLMAARYLERIADHVTNVGERVYQMETGEYRKLHD